MNRRRLSSALVAALALVSCRAVAPIGPLAGSGVGGPFALVDQDGRAVTDRTYAGRWRLMYFGYTFCPDVCPVDVQKLAQGLKAFAATAPDRAAKVVGIFVTVDPARDTPSAMKTFVRAFSPTLIGLSGSIAQVDAAAKAYKIYVQRGAPSPSGYTVDHSATIYLMDPDNRPVSFLDHDATPAKIAAELATYVR